jgi:hypothetical protein
MGYFKQGNLILKQTQKVQVQDVDISTDGSKVEVNSTVQVDGLQIGTGPVITSISNSIASDSTAELMTSSAVEGAINDAVSAFSGSGGAEPLASIFNPREDVKSSRYNVASQDIADLTYDNITASATDNRFGVCALKSGLIALASRDTSATGITVEYYKENGDSINSLSLLTQYSSATLGPAAIKDMASTPSGKLISIFAVGTTERYLIAVNENCTDKIELQLPYDSVPYAYGVLPNDEVVMYAYNGSTYSMGIYKPDFDSSSFIAIKAFAVVTDGTGNGTPLEGPTIKFIGSNQVVVPSGNGAQIINLESHAYIASNEFTVSTSCLVENSNNIVTMIGATSTPSIYAKTFDFSGNDVTSEQIIVLSDKYDQGIPNIRLLPSGDFIVLYQGVGGYIRYIIFNSLLETLYEGVTTIESNSLDCASDILPNGKLLIGSDAGSSVNISVLKFVGNTRKELHLGDTVINDLQVSTSINGASDSIPTSNAIIGAFGNYNDKVSPFSKNRYMSGSGIFGQGELDWEYSGTPMWILNIANVGSDSYRSSYIKSTLLSNGNVCIFYRGTIARDFFALTLDPITFEILNTETWDNTLSTSLDFKDEGVLKTWDGVALILTYVQSPFPSGTSVLMAYHQNTGWFNLNISSTVKGYCVLDNNDILIFRYNYDMSKIDMATYRADIDTTSFVSITEWVDCPVPLVENDFPMRITPLGNGKFLCNLSTTELMEFDLNGNYQIISKTDYGLTFGIGFCLDNRIIIIGKDSSNKITFVILDKQYRLLKTVTTEFYNTAFNVFYGIPEILSNGDITFSIHDTNRNSEPIAIFIKPNNEYQITNRYNYSSTAGAVSSRDSNPMELPNGDVLYIDYAAVANFYILGRIYKKVNKWTDKIEVLENLNRRNQGTYNQKVIKYQPQLVYKNTTPSTSSTRTLGYFNNGKLLIVDSALYGGSYWHPHLSILDQNNNLTVNLKPIDFGSSINVNQYIYCDLNYQVLAFNNKPMCIFSVTTAGGQRLLIVVDDNGNTVCEPWIPPTASSYSFGLLENDDIIVLEYVSSTIPPEYTQGTGSYVSTYRVSEDSTSLVNIQFPIHALVLAANGSGNIFPFDSNTMIGIYNNNVNIIDSKTFSIRANRLAFNTLDTGSVSILNRRPPSLDGKHFYISSYTFSGFANTYVAKYKYDRTNEEVSIVDEALVSSGMLTALAAQLYMFETPNDYLAVPVHSVSSGGVYKEGIIMLDRDMNQIQADDYLYFGATETYASFACTISRNGEIALLGRGVASYDTYVKKFRPVIEMTSPMNACLDVNYVTDTTSVTTINRKHIGQVIAYSSTTSHTIYVPSDSNDDLPLGFTCTLARLSSGDLTLAVDGGGVSISSISGNTSLRVAGSTAVLTKIDRNKWQLSGDLD